MSVALTRPVFVVLEGLDGSGKSSCAKRVAELLGAVYLTTPSPTVREFREKVIQSFGDCQEAAQLFYLATVHAASAEVESLLARGTSVVLDRYFLSTQAYAEFRGSRLQLDSLGAGLLAADLTVFLDAPLEVRRARMAERGSSVADRETLSTLADVRLRETHAKRSTLPVVGGWLPMDSSACSPVELAVRVADAAVAVSSRPRCRGAKCAGSHGK